MAYADKTQLRKDGFQSLESGMNSGRSPVLLQPQECAYAVNTSFRGGYPKNRQQFRKVVLSDNGNLAGFQTGLFQGAYIYDIADGTEVILAMAAGTLYRIDIAGGGATVQQIFNDGHSNATAPMVWFAQADTYMVIQDGSSNAIIMQGMQSIRRANPTATIPEVPVGQSMAYGQGRLWVAQGRNWVAGDILGGITSVINFQEQTYLAEAGFFGVPLQAGSIVGMAFIEVGDTQTGQGELLTFARNAVYSTQAGVPRAATQTQQGWQGTANMQRVTLTNIGGTGWRNLLPVNSDMFFRSKDGWRTYRTARNEAYGWGGAPISREVNRLLVDDSLQLLDFSSAVLFKNRVLMTAAPLPIPNSVGGGAYFQTLVALDMDVVSSVINKSNLAFETSPYFANRGSPCYDGQWNPPAGIGIYQLISHTFSFVERCFVFARNEGTGQTEMWELTDDQLYDENQENIVTQIETRALDCKLPDALKELRRCDLYFDLIQSTIDVTIEYKSDGYQSWVKWAECTIPGQGQWDGTGTPPSNLCNIQPCSVPGYCPTGKYPLSGGYWMPKKLGSPNGECDPITGKLLRNGYYFQFRITWKGPAELIMFLIHTTEYLEDPQGSACCN